MPKPRSIITTSSRRVHAGLPGRRKLLSFQKTIPTSTQVIEDLNLFDEKMVREEKKFYPSTFLKHMHYMGHDISDLKAKRKRIMRHGLRDSRRHLKSNAWAFMSLLVFKQMHLRLRKLIGQEQNDRFDSRDGRRPKRFSFNPQERRRLPGLEYLIYPRTLYRTKRSGYRRDQAPGDHKHRKGLQFFRRFFAPSYRNRRYVRNRRWPRLRTANYRLHLPMFEFRTSRSAQRHYQKLARHKTLEHSDERFMRGTGNRLDVTLILLGIAPTPFWARAMAPLGMISINKKEVYDRKYRLKAGDMLRLDLKKIRIFRQYFQPYERKVKNIKTKRYLTTLLPKNISYYHKVGLCVYRRLPRASDIPKNNRVNRLLHLLFRLEAGKNRR